MRSWCLLGGVLCLMQWSILGEAGGGDAPLEILRARPNKLVYDPGETAFLDIVLKNKAAREISLTLKASLVYGIDRETSLPSQTLTVPKEETVSVKISFEAGAKEYGYLAKVDFFLGDKRVDSKSDVFCVTTDFHEVALGGMELFQMTADTGSRVSEGEIRAEVENARQKYITKIESVFWAPSDWGKWMPDKKRWYSGQGGRHHDWDALKEYIRAAHEHGIKCVGYVKSTAGGPAALEIARRHPDWFGGNPFYVGGLSTYWLAHYWDDEQKFKEYSRDEGLPIFSDRWISLYPDFSQLEVFDYGIDDILKSIREFGWDGMRFDGHWLVMDSVPISLRNARRMKERIWKQYPDFQIGFNYGYNPAAEGYRTGRYTQWSREDSLKEIHENMAGGGEYMPEALRVNRYLRGASYQSWRHLADLEGEAVELLRRMGGTYSVIFEDTRFVSQEWLAVKLAAILSAGAHPEYGGHLSASSRWCPHWGRFLLRWSPFLWDYAIVPQNPDELGIAVEGPENLYWKNRVYERIEDAATRQLIVHLLNLPAEDRIRDPWTKKEEYPEAPPLEKLQIPLKQEGGIEVLDEDFEDETLSEALGVEDPNKKKKPEDPLPPLKDIRFQVKLPQNQTLKGLYLIDPAQIDVAQRLDYETKDGHAVFAVESVELWSMVVFQFHGELERPGRPPKFAPPPDPEQLKKDEEKWAGKSARLPTLEEMRDRLKESLDRPAYPRTISVLHPDGRRRLGPVVEDSRASAGKAERNEDASENDGAAFGTATPFAISCAGKYRVQIELLFEPGVTEETSLHVAIEHHDEATGRQIQWVGKVSAKDVKKNEYQAHSFDFVHRFPANMGITVKRNGPGAIRCGTITFQLLEPFNESQIVEVLGGPKIPEALSKLRPGWGGSPDVLVLAGWFYPHYRFPEMARALGEKTKFIERMPEKPAKTAPDMNQAVAEFLPAQSGGEEEEQDGEVLEELEGSGAAAIARQKASAGVPQVELSAFIGRELGYENIFRRDTVILANVHADWLGYGGRKILYEYVQAGGTLFVLGGDKSYGHGNYQHTFMEELFPVTFANHPDLVKLDPPARIPDLAREVTVYYLHWLKPKEEAKVTLWAVTSQGERLPFLLEQSVGKGRVIACLGSVFGESRNDGDIPFWEWEGWPEVLGKAIVKEGADEK